MAQSLQDHIEESARAIEVEAGKLLDLVVLLNAAGNIELAWVVSMQAQKLIDAAVALRVAMAE
ncbi:hypothetical protein [Pseudomonas fluorescens]|uniref:Uncharacterized protein n=1 Tax=Pseudomonas fluorescens TaxID=294 RepID=A0A5E7Q4R0_PSEFL|nr:hypothetical protein [Pseudomonas fluorescens]VVP56814.1 hypothetical protein PS880_05757 [Pseudomonas fluorescens]